MATNFNTTGLADFTAANPQRALSLVILEGVGTKDHYAYETGVKYQTKVPYISSVDLDISTGAIAGYNTGSGQTTIEDVTLSNKQLKIFETYTKEQLNKTILASLTPGTDPSDLPMEDMIVALKAKKIFVENEKLIWQADTSTSVQTEGTTLNEFDGVLAQVTGVAGGYGDAATSFQSLTDASVLGHVKSLVNKMESEKPEFVTVPTVMSMSPANFAAYSRALYNLNGTVTTDTIGANGQLINEVYVPGTQIKVVSEIGLNGKNEVILTVPENIIVAYDLVDESESLGFIYNPFARWHELAAAYKLGVKVVDPSNCIISE